MESHLNILIILIKQLSIKNVFVIIQSIFRLLEPIHRKLDLLINSTGDGTLGRVAQVWFAPKALTVDSHVTIVRPAREELIFYIGLWGILHEKEIESLHTGSTGQTELPRDRLKMLKLLLPDNISLSRFNSIITPMASTIISNQEENQKLASLRDTLLPKLMSGEIDVSNIQF